MKLKLNVDLNGKKKDSVIDIEDQNGIATDPYWRSRIKDSIIDNCVEIVNESKQIQDPVVKKEAKKAVEINQAADEKKLEVKDDDNK